MNQGALPGFNFGVGEAKSQLEGLSLTIGMQQFTEEALIAGLKVNSIFNILEENQVSPLIMISCFLLRYLYVD